MKNINFKIINFVAISFLSANVMALTPTPTSIPTSPTATAVPYSELQKIVLKTSKCDSKKFLKLTKKIVEATIQNNIMTVKTELSKVTVRGTLVQTKSFVNSPKGFSLNGKYSLDRFAPALTVNHPDFYKTFTVLSKDTTTSTPASTVKLSSFPVVPDYVSETFNLLCYNEFVYTGKLRAIYYDEKNKKYSLTGTIGKTAGFIVPGILSYK